MNSNSNSPASGLAPGQLWNTDNNYLQILDLWKNLAHYRIMRGPGQAGIVTGVIRLDALAVYLRACDATLIA